MMAVLARELHSLFSVAGERLVTLYAGLLGGQQNIAGQFALQRRAMAVSAGRLVVGLVIERALREPTRRSERWLHFRR